MVVTDQVTLRAETVNRTVRGFALQEYKFKQLCLVSPSSSWRETYYQESPTDLTGGTGSNMKGVSRLSDFPFGQVTETRVTARLLKFGAEGQISFEDEQTAELDMIARTLLRISRAVANAVDLHIWDVLTESQTVVNINTVAIAAGSEWDSATLANQNPIQNILDGMRKIQENNYDVYSSGYLLLNPKDFANLMGNANIRNAGQFYTSDVTQNGRVGRLLGLTVIVSTSVTADYAAVCIGQQAATFKQAVALTTEVINDPGIKKTIRAWEVGVTQLTDPKAVCLISNTAA